MSVSPKLLPAILTGNALMSGDAVYRDAAGGWSVDPAAAVLFDDVATAEAALKAAEAEPHLVVGPYLAKPDHYREKIRATGPSFRTDLGKQAGA